MIRATDCDLPVIIVGAGGHARVLLDALRLCGVQVLFATDCEKSRRSQSLEGIEIRDDSAIDAYTCDRVRLVNAVGSVSSMARRRDVYKRFRDRGFQFATIIHPSSTVSASAVIGSGVQIMAGAIVQPGAQLSEDVIVNTRASIDHDCRIGAHVHLAPGVTLSGNVSIGESCHIGTSATVIQGVRIGAEAMVAAGSVVIRNVDNGGRIAGVPGRPMAQKQAAAPESPVFTVMLSAAGRRVALLRLLRESIRQLGRRPRIISTDITRLGAAYHVGDESRVVPRYSDPNCLDALTNICREHNVDLIVPTIDPDLPFFSKHKCFFQSLGTRIMVSDAETIRISNDKVATHQWLTAHGFPTVRQTQASSLASDAIRWEYPVFVKPRMGSSSTGARIVKSRAALEMILADESDLIVQEIAPGDEYTVDVFVDSKGRCRCAVPRLRMETRGGEVTKAMTCRLPPLQQLATQVAEALPGASGAMNIQMFYDARSGRICIIEINARLGGGYPLAHVAGAEMIRWAIEGVLGNEQCTGADSWADGLVMLRYDEAVFVTREQAGRSVPQRSSARQMA